MTNCRRKVIDDGSIASNKSVVTESTSKSCSSTEVQDEDASITAVIDAAELKWLVYHIPFPHRNQYLVFLVPCLMMISFGGACREEQPYKRGQASGRFTSVRHYGNAEILLLQFHVLLILL